MPILEEEAVWVGGYFVPFQEFSPRQDIFQRNVFIKAKKRAEKKIFVLDLAVNTVKVSSFLFDANCMGILCLNRLYSIRSHPENFFYGKPLATYQIFSGFYIYRLGTIRQGSGGKIHNLCPSGIYGEVKDISNKIVLGKV